jgi:hypothetical protein
MLALKCSLLIREYVLVNALKALDVQNGLSIVVYVRGLLLVESSDLRPSNQYVLVKVIPSCFHFVKMCLCQVSLNLRLCYINLFILIMR